jgi:hypothetical protein
VRAEQVAGLRRLAEFIEKNPQLPCTVGAIVYAHGQTREAAQAFADTYGAEFREYDYEGVRCWRASVAVALIAGCHPVEFAMAGSEQVQ